MVKLSMKLVPQPDDEWDAVGNVIAHLECPVCYSLVSMSSQDEHIKWHRDLADLLIVLGGSNWANLRG